MDTFFIIPNQLKQQAVEQAQVIKEYLENKGKVCYVRDNPLTGPETGSQHKYRFTNASMIPEDVECVLVLGGDGTLLQASRDLVGRGIPLLGINMGTLGYLAEIEIGNVYQALDRLITHTYTIEKRMMITGSVERDGKRLFEDIALNDIFIGRRGPLRVIDFAIYVNDTFLCSYRADGIILATATGSTGYNLSAGGPIVAPDASLMLLTPVAPHTLAARSIVLPDHVEVTVEIGNERHPFPGGTEVTFDGDSSFNLVPGDRVHISRSPHKTKLIKINHTSFVEILRHKMNGA